MIRSLRLLPFVAILAAAACNTVEGAGQDLSTAGSAISSEANQAKK